MRNLLDYILPKRCVNCHRILSQDVLPLCQNCYHHLPFTHWSLGQSNPTYEVIYQIADITRASSLLLYRHGNSVKKLIMSNKYYNQRRIGFCLAELSVPILEHYRFEVISCIPSHGRTRRQRGYNQVELFTERLGQLLAIKCAKDLITRKKRRDSQTHKSKEERYTALENAFDISTKVLDYNSLLLVDDVVTTGATLSSCCQKLLTIHPKLDISVFTMAKVV